jgi:phage protein D
MPPNDPQQGAFAVGTKVLIDGTEINAADVTGFITQHNFGSPCMAAITLRNDTHTHTKDRNHGQTVEIKTGAATEGSPEASIFKGKIVCLEPIYKAQGDSRVVIRAFNDLHKLTRGKKSKTYQNMDDQAIVNQICGQHGLTADCGTDPKITHEHKYQHNQTDLEYVRVLAARLGFQVWCEDTTLYFKRPAVDQDSGIELKLAESGEHHLKSFSCRISSAQVIKKCTVRAWDPKKKEELVGDYEQQNTPLGGKHAASAAGDFGQTVTFAVDRPVFSVQEAQAIARSKVDEANFNYITGLAECRGNGAYKLGMVVKITPNADDASYRLNTKFLIAGVKHTYSHGTGGNQTGGYTTYLDVWANGENG